MEAPKVFVSYCHISEEHKDWVKKLSIRLRGHGVDVTLDQWDLQLGQRLPRFMETIKNHDKVLMVCSKKYVENANNASSGGVAKERTYIESILDKDLDATSVIAILRDNSDKSLPDFYDGRLRLNFDKEEDFEKNYWELASALLGQKLEAKPLLGRNPFLTGLDLNFGRANGIAVINEQKLTAHAFDVNDNNILILANKNQNEPCVIMLDELGGVKQLFNDEKIISLNEYHFSCLSHNIDVFDSKYLLSFCHATQQASWVLSTIEMDLNGKVITNLEDKNYHTIVCDNKLSNLPSYENEIKIVIKLGNSLNEANIICLNMEGLQPIRSTFCTRHKDKIYLFGSGDWSMTIYRFNIDGTIDETFKNEQGKNTYRIDACFLNAYGITFQTDDKVLIVGDGNEANILRLNYNGTIDTSFADNGMLEFRATYRSSGRRVFIHNDKILMSGVSNNGSGLSEIFLARFTLDGKPDYTFNGEENYFSVNIKGRDELIDMIITSDNKAFLLCQSDSDAGKYSKIALLKLHI